MSVDIFVGPVQQDLPEMALSVQVGIAIVIQIYPRFKFCFSLIFKEREKNRKSKPRTHNRKK